MAIQWTNSLSVENTSVDNDHKSLINIINQIEKAIENEMDTAALQKGLKDLETYTHEHFSKEEALMKAVSYPNYYRHFKEHRELINKLINIKNDIFKELSDTEQIKDPAELIDLLRHWLLDHVVKEDLLMKPYLKKLIP